MHMQLYSIEKLDCENKTVSVGDTELVSTHSRPIFNLGGEGGGNSRVAKTQSAKFSSTFHFSGGGGLFLTTQELGILGKMSQKFWKGKCYIKFWKPNLFLHHRCVWTLISENG